MKKLFFYSITFLSLFFLSCNERGSVYVDYETLNTHRSALSVISDCGTYKDYVLDVAARQIADVRYGYGRYWGVPEVDASADPSSPNDGKSAGEFTTTNVQEAGVDELDVVKNDGKYFYLVNESKFHIVQVWPPVEMKELSRVTYQNTGNNYEYPMGLFLENDTVVVLTSGWSYEGNDEVFGWAPYRGRSLTNAIFYDVSDRVNPRRVKTLEFPSNLVDARFIEGKLYLALNHSRQAVDAYAYRDVQIPGVPAAEYLDDWNERQALVAKTTPIIRAYLEEHSKSWNIDDLFPKLKLIDANNAVSERDFISCNDFYLPETASKNSGLLSIVSIDLKAPETLHATTIADSSWLLYASKKNIYISSTSSNWFWFSEVASGTARENYTHIHQFTLIPSQTKTQYMGSGEVNGIVQNQFWMSEYKDHLRVASQSGWWSDTENGNSLTILKRDGIRLVETGRISGIAKGESIYAARMFADKGYMVTFKRIDPLFTIDLSNPNDPKILGELKINGYSSYIHPLSEGYLLTIGEDATDEGRVLGLHLQIFDVRDMKNPVRVQHELIARAENSYSYSQALYDHHAFTYHAGSGLLAIPFNEYQWSEWEGKSFSGILIYKVSPESGFSRLGVVDHSDLVANAENRWWVNLNRSRIYFETAGVYDKSAYIYTLSNLGLKVNDLNALKSNVPVVPLQ